MTANAGYHAYATGDVLTAAQVQYNLQNQTTMYFASASARTTALTGVIVEGMVSYIPANGIEYYNGSAWVSISQAVTALTTKGDLLTYSTQDTRLPVGSDGQTLVANSAATTGLQWASTPSASNPVLNSAMQVWQRGTSFSIAASTGAGSTTFSADRWQTATNANQAITISRQATGDTTNLPNIQYCLRYQRNSGQTGTGSLNFSQNFETVNTISFAGKTITYSFYARAGANYSPTSSALIGIVYTGTGTDQNVFSGYTGNAYNLTTATLTTTWQRFSVTMAIPSTATEMAPGFQYNPTGTAGTNDYYEVTGVQIDVGSVALPFRTYAATIQGELAACQRYYYRNTATGTYTRFGMGQVASTTNVYGLVTFPVTMRTKPLALEQSGTAANYGVTNVTSGVVACSSTPAFDQANVQGGSVVFVVASGLVAGNASQLLDNNSSTAYLGWSAEL